MILQRSSFFLYPPAHLPPWRAWSRPVTFQCRLLRLYPAYGVSSCAHLSARPLGWLPAYILTDLSVSGSDRLVFKGPDQSSTACPGWCENPPETMNYRLLARMAPARKTGDGQSGSRIEACEEVNSILIHIYLLVSIKVPSFTLFSIVYPPPPPHPSVPISTTSHLT